MNRHITYSTLKLLSDYLNDLEPDPGKNAALLSTVVQAVTAEMAELYAIARQSQTAGGIVMPQPKVTVRWDEAGVKASDNVSRVERHENGDVTVEWRNTVDAGIKPFAEYAMPVMKMTEWMQQNIGIVEDGWLKTVEDKPQC